MYLILWLSEFLFYTCGIVSQLVAHMKFLRSRQHSLYMKYRYNIYTCMHMMVKHNPASVSIIEKGWCMH